MEFTIKGNEINEAVLRECGVLLTPKIERKAKMVVGVFFLALIAIAFSAGLQGLSLTFIVLMCYVFFVLPVRRREKVIRQMVGVLRKQYGYPSCSFDVTFEAEGIKSINVASKETVRIPYGNFGRAFAGKTVIALTTPQGQLVVLHRDHMDEEQYDALMKIIDEKCVNIGKA